MSPFRRFKSHIRPVARAAPEPPASRPTAATGLELGVGQQPLAGALPPTEELRFGLVLYGGVSLAIYIYGVVYEFWRLVRASQGATSNAYSELLRECRVTASVDIISGASAGGINGILLAKALAEGADLEVVRRIWVHEAHLLDLLRDRSEREPRSLLSTQRFEQLLASALDDMDSDSEATPLVRALDLFVSATRLEPWLQDFPTDLDRTIRAATYGKHFHLKQRVAGYNPEAKELGELRADFGRSENRTLTEIARATSAFPGAFEPRLIERIEQTDRLYHDDEPASSYFSDGGILDNKPFTRAISAIVGRAADLKVRRWLVSVEPDPEHFADRTDAEPQVDAVIAKATFKIPRYQSIADDLDRSSPRSQLA